MGITSNNHSLWFIKISICLTGRRKSLMDTLLAAVLEVKVNYHKIKPLNHLYLKREMQIIINWKLPWVEYIYLQWLHGLESFNGDIAKNFDGGEQLALAFSN